MTAELIKDACMPKVYPWSRDQDGGVPYVFTLKVTRNRDGDMEYSYECDRDLAECVDLEELLTGISSRIAYQAGKSAPSSARSGWQAFLDWLRITLPSKRQPGRRLFDLLRNEVRRREQMNITEAK